MAHFCKPQRGDHTHRQLDNDLTSNHVEPRHKIELRVHVYQLG